MNPARALPAGLLALALALAGGAAAAQPRAAHAPGDAPTDATPAEPVDVAVTQTIRANFHRARAALRPLAPAVARCVAVARGRDPAHLARARGIELVVRLRADGTARSVEVSPSWLPPGLSACLADALFAWRQGGALGPRPAVRIRVDLAGRGRAPDARHTRRARGGNRMRS